MEFELFKVRKFWTICLEVTLYTIFFFKKEIFTYFKKTFKLKFLRFKLTFIKLFFLEWGEERIKKKRKFNKKLNLKGRLFKVFLESIFVFKKIVVLLKELFELKIIWVNNRNRTHNLQNHNLLLYQLSYIYLILSA